MTTKICFRFFVMSALFICQIALAQIPADQSSETEENPPIRSKSKSKGDQPLTPQRMGKSKNQEPALVKDGLAPTPDQTSWWSPKGMRHSIGVELSDSSFGVLGTDAVAYGFSLEKVEFDFYFAYTKESNSAAESVTQSSNDISTPKTLSVTRRYSGSESPRRTTIGIQPKYVFFSDRWFKSSVGMMLAYAAKTSVSYKTGSVTTSYADSSNLSNYSVSETGLGSVSSTSSAKMIYGPRLSVEFYLKWFPHIGLGFGTGLLMTQGGDTTTKTTTQTRSYSVTNGVAGTPTSSQTSSATDTVKTGGSSRTIAVGGTRFSLLGNFAIRYIW